MKRSVMSMCILIVALGCFSIVEADAQNNEEKKWSEMRQKIRALKKRKIVEALALSKDTAARVMSIIDKHDAKRHELFVSLRNDLGNLKKAVDNKKDEAEKKALIDKIAQTRKELSSVKQAETDELRNVLTVDEQARFILFSIDFHKTIRKIMAEKMSRSDNESKGD